MGFKFKMPKITIGDPGKLVTNAVAGITNTVAGATNAVTKSAVDVGSGVLSGAGSLMSNPAAAPILGMAGAAYGIPGMGSLASGFASKPMASTAQETPQIPVFNSAPSGSGSNKTMMIMGASVGGLLLIMVLFLSMKKGK